MIVVYSRCIHLSSIMMIFITHFSYIMMYLTPNNYEIHMYSMFLLFDFPIVILVICYLIFPYDYYKSLFFITCMFRNFITKEIKDAFRKRLNYYLYSDQQCIFFRHDRHH